MTATNGGSQGRIVERVEGVVTASNARGVKLAGRDEYVNFSKYASPPIAPPRRGQHVTLGLDADGYVCDLVVDLGAAAPPASDRERIITRLSVLRSAATFVAGYAQCREDVKSSDVLAIADVWLKWVEQELRA